MFSHRASSYLIKSLGLVLLFGAGCARDQAPGGSTSTAPQRLYLTIAEPPMLLVYKDGVGGGQLPEATITEHAPDRPIDCAANQIGEVYVANQNGAVRVFGTGHDPKKYDLIRSYEGSHTRLDHPVAIAVNRAGSFYVADTADGHGRVEWFSGGANEDILPDKVLEGSHTGITTPGGVAIDGSGRTFVTDRASNRILIFDPNARDDATPLATIDGVHAPGRIVIDDLLNLYVVNTADNSIMVFTSTGPEGWTPAPPIRSDAMQGLAAIAIDQAGQIAAGATGGVLLFANDGHNDANPIASLHGASASFNPSGVCFH